MARPKSDGPSKDLFRNMSHAEWWTRLDTAMKNSGMLMHIAKTPELRIMLKEHEDRVNQNEPGLFTRDRNWFMYETRSFVVRHLLKNDNNWMIRWVSNPKRLSPVNIVKEEFLKYGPSALPEYYKHATKFGGVFRWDSPKALVTIIMMLRGLGKSHNEVVCRSITDFVNDPSEKCLIGHSEDEKAEDLLKRIRDALFHPNLMIAFPEFFVDNIEMYRARGVEIKKERINMKVLDFNDMFRVIDPSDYMRGESTWNLFTPRVDVTGQHFNRIKLDDFVTEKNSRTAERVDDITNTFYSLSGLEEYTFDENGKTVGIPIQITDTQYFVPNMITDVLENRKVKAFIMPMTWDPDEHKTIYSYCKEHIYRIDPMVDNDFIDRKKEDDKTEAKFLSQRYMIGMERCNSIQLAADRNSFIFKYKDEAGLSENIYQAPFEFEFAHRALPVIISKDPSYSNVGKEIGDARSKDATIRLIYSKGIYYVTGSVRELGNRSLEGQVAPFITLSYSARPDYCIIDSQATQSFVADSVFKELNDKAFKDYRVEYIGYTKKKESDVPGKVARIQEVLSTLFNMGAIKIHWKLTDVVNQILRVDTGFDFLDALVMARSSVSQDDLEVMEYLKRSRYKDEMEGSENILQNNRNSGIIFRTTGY